MPEPRLADDAERLPLLDRKIDAVNRLDMADRLPEETASDREPHAQILGLEDGLGFGVCRRRRALGFRCDEMLGVGVLRGGEDFARLAPLDDLAAIHDADPVGHLPHDAEIVGDEQHRHVELGLELEQEVEDLRLDRDVERGRRLVGDEEIGFVGERHGDHDALPLPARELMRIGLEPSLGVVDADFLEQIEHARARLLVRHPAVNLQHLAHLLFDRVQRIERGHRLLEDHRDLVAPDVAERARIEGQEVHAVEADTARRMRRGGVGQEPQDRQRRHRLARARFADERHGLGLADIEGHLADGVGDGLSGAEIDRQILYRYQGVVRLGHLKPWLWRGRRRRSFPARFRWWHGRG